MSGLQLTVLAMALLCGIVAGAFFAFSGFVMAALGRLPSAQGIAAMQSINRLAVTPPLMIALFVPALLGIGLGIWAVLSWDEPEAPWVLAGCLLYLVGVIGVTAVANVPRNNRLEALDPADPDAAEYWSRYLAGWTAWNTVRTVASLVAATLLTIALHVD